MTLSPGLAVPRLVPINASMSFQPPGPAYCARFLSTASALFMTPPQLLTSYPTRHALPSVLPTGAYQLLQPRRAR